MDTSEALSTKRRMRLVTELSLHSLTAMAPHRDPGTSPSSPTLSSSPTHSSSPPLPRHPREGGDPYPLPRQTNGFPPTRERRLLGFDLFCSAALILQITFSPSRRAGGNAWPFPPAPQRVCSRPIASRVAVEKTCRARRGPQGMASPFQGP